MSFLSKFLGRDKAKKATFSPAKWLSSISSSSGPIEERLEKVYDADHEEHEGLVEGFQSLLLKDAKLRKAIIAKHNAESQADASRLLYWAEEMAFGAENQLQRKGSRKKKPKKKSQRTGVINLDRVTRCGGTRGRDEIEHRLLHDWDYDQWNDALHHSRWPQCRRCGISMISFIDGSEEGGDLPPFPSPRASALEETRQRLQQNHAVLTAQINAFPAEHWPYCKPIKIDPWNSIEALQQDGLRIIVWPLWRMAGWNLYLAGGIRKMRTGLNRAASIADRPFNIGTVESIWHGIGGLGISPDQDVWLA